MQKGSFLKVVDGVHEFLLSSDDAVSIERRDVLELNNSEGGSVVAWFNSDGVRWPTIRLCQLIGMAAGQWTQAVFLRTGRHTVGIVAENVQLAGGSHSAQVKPFTMIGGVDPNSVLYSGVCFDENESTLILDSRAIARQVAQHIGLV